MLSLAVLSAHGKRYYLEQAKGRVSAPEGIASGAEDYYLGGSEPAGRFGGSLAASLGIAGREADEESLTRMLGHRNPATGEELEGPVKRATVPGFDLMFSVPKSASILFGVGGLRMQRAVMGAQREAVAQAITYLERDACLARRGAGGQDLEQAGGFLSASFEHRTSRAGDPQIHTHVLVANAVRRADGQWAAPDGRALFHHAKTAGYIHEAAFRRALTRELGVEWGRVVNGIADVAGVPEEAIRAFSRRAREIAAQVKSWGTDSAAAKQSAAIQTRAAKDYEVTPEELAPEWERRAAEYGLDRDGLAALADRTTYRALDEHELGEAARELAGQYGLTLQAAHFDRRDVIQAFAARAQRGAELGDIDAFVDSFLSGGRVIPLAHDPGALRRSELIRLRDGRLVSAAITELRYSTPEMLEIEREVIDTALARRGRGTATARADSVERALAARPTIGTDQEEMVRRLCLDHDGVQVVVGPAGTGKTFALDAAREAWRDSGVQVVGAAVARAAARTLQESAGIPSTSVAALLADLGRGGEFSLARKSVLIVDEAATLSTRELRQLLQHTGRVGAKLVLVGDHHQLPEIEAGGAFRGLAIRLNAIQLTDNRRQGRDRDRRKVELLRDGQVSEALQITREQGELVVVPDAERLYDRLAADYVDALRHGEDAIMLAARRDEVRQLNSRAREHLDAGGLLGGERLVLDGGEFAAGDHVVIKRNDRQLGVANSNRGRVTAIDRRQRTLQIELLDGRRVTLDGRFLDQRARRDGPSLAHGYAMTAHVAQGTTTSRAFVLGSEAIYQEWAYSAFTRARRDTRFYVCDPDWRGERSHGAREPEPVERIERAMRRSRMQEMAMDLAR